MDTNGHATLSLDVIVALLETGDIPAFVEHTGGGCATICAGAPYADASGAERYPALCGPGWFGGTGVSGDTRDLYAGPDNDGEDDSFSLDGFTSEAEAAALIAALVVAHAESAS